MSALGQKQTSGVDEAMSALPPIADIQTQPEMSALCQKQTSERNGKPSRNGSHSPLSAQHVN